jgi:hypothetical protein
MEDSTYRGTYQGILDSMGFKSGEERKLAREERSSFLKERGDQGVPISTYSDKVTTNILEQRLLNQVGGVTLGKQEGPPYQMPSYVPKTGTPATVPNITPSPFDYRSIPGATPSKPVTVESTIENALKTLSTSLDTKLGEANKYLLGILNGINVLFGVEPGKTGYRDQLQLGKNKLAAPISVSQYLSPEKTLPKVETKLSLNINSTSQLLVDGRLMAAVVKQYLYEDLLRSQGVSGTNSMTITI